MGLSHSPRIVTDGLVFCVDAANKRSYPGAGTTWTDLTANKNNGTLTNGPTFDSANGGSIVFDGTDDYVSFGSSLSSVSNVTVQGWIKAHSFNRDAILSYAHPTSQGSWLRFAVRIISGTTGKIAIGGQFGGTSHEVTGGSILQQNIYYNVCFTANGSSWSCFINSEEENLSVLAGSNTGYDFSYSGLSVLTIANLYRAVYGNVDNFDGNISNISIYNRVLTPDEIRQNYNATRGRFQ